jgi:hypothetical protein
MNNKSINLLCLLFLSLLSCKQTSNVEETVGTFVVYNLGVNFGPWDTQNNTAGDFIFHWQESKVFLEFGAVVATGDGGTKELPTFEYKLRKDAQVFAIAEGTVTRFAYQEDTQDYEFAVQSNENPNYEVGYDHVTNPLVAPGDEVSPGDILGNPGTWSANLGRFEIMINNYETGLSYCPFCFFNPDSLDAYQDKVLQFMWDWEVFKNNTSIYDEDQHVYPGCRMSSMVSY